MLRTEPCIRQAGTMLTSYILALPSALQVLSLKEVILTKASFGRRQQGITHLQQLLVHPVKIHCSHRLSNFFVAYTYLKQENFKVNHSPSSWSRGWKANGLITSHMLSILESGGSCITNALPVMTLSQNLFLKCGTKGQRCSSVAKCLPSMLKDLGSISRTAKDKIQAQHNFMLTSLR